MSESSPMLEIGKAALLHLGAYLGALRTYSPNNTVVINSRRLLMEALDARLSGNSLRIQLLDNASFANDQLLNLTVNEFERSADLTRLLRDYDVGEVVFGPDVQADDLEALATVVSEKKRSSMHSKISSILLTSLLLLISSSSEIAPTNS